MEFFVIIMRLFLQLCIAVWNGMMRVVNAIIGRENAKRIEKNNQISRGVIEDKSVPISSVFHDGCLRNSIISGSEEFVRNLMLINGIKNAHSHKCPIIVLHESNTDLEALVQQHISDSIIINRKSSIFDPFFNRTENEIIKMVLSLGKKEYGLQDQTRYAIKGMMEFLMIKGKKPSLSALSSCPYDELYDKLDDMVQKRKISSAQAQRVKSLLSSGQGEHVKLESFLVDFKDECERLLISGSTTIYDITRAVEEKKVLLFDIGSSSNKLLLGYIASQIEMCIRNGHTLSIVIDNISLSKDSSDLIKLLSTNSSRCNVTITTNDLYAMVNSDEKFMYTFLGNSLENIIMQHGSAVSAEEWSKAIGYYDKTETTTTVSQGKTKGGFSLFPSYNENKSLAYSIKREAIVKSEEIIRMSNNEMYIYDRARNELRHCYVTN